MHERLDFTTPNGTTPARLTSAPTPRKQRPICGFCFQEGEHQSAAQCLSSLDYAASVKAKSAANGLTQAPVGGDSVSGTQGLTFS